MKANWCGLSVGLLVLVPTLCVLVKAQSVFESCRTPGHIAITFDDGPHFTLSQQIRDVFNSRNLKATFFLNGVDKFGADIELYKELVLKAYNEGHQIGSHTWSHPDLTNLTPDEVRAELKQMNDLLFDIIGKNVTVFRPPHGSYNAQVLDIAENEFNYAVVNWNINTNDWAHPDDVEAGLQEYVRGIENINMVSYIALHHDWTGGSVELATRAIQYVQEQNLTIVTVAECLGIQMYQ